ncbi:interferon-like [Pseudopipra pipra]|uniref:interferon-like n=1 Tax=Pseudopipra pipra TaxID=415032 RepID=UPI003139A498
MAALTTPQHRLGHAAPTLLLLLTALTAALACQHLWIHHDTFPWEQLQLLDHMAPNSTHTCQLQNPPFFPDTLRRNNLNPQQAVAAALRILQHLFHTLSANSTSQHWHTQTRHRLLNQLQHHIHRLEQCRPDNARLFKGPRNPLTAINKYFKDIHLFLHAHNHTACAWDHVRLEARASFQHLHNLTRTIRRHPKHTHTPPTTTPL